MDLRGLLNLLHDDVREKWTLEIGQPDKCRSCYAAFRWSVDPEYMVADFGSVKMRYIHSAIRIAVLMHDPMVE